MDQWEVYSMLKGNRPGMTEAEIVALENELPEAFWEGVIEYLLTPKRVSRFELILK